MLKAVRTINSVLSPSHCEIRSFKRWVFDTRKRVYLYGYIGILDLFLFLKISPEGGEKNFKMFKFNLLIICYLKCIIQGWSIRRCLFKYLEHICYIIFMLFQLHSIIVLIIRLSDLILLCSYIMSFLEGWHFSW